MAPNIGDSIKNAVANAAHAVEDVVENVRAKVTGHPDDEANETPVTDDATVAPTTPEPTEVVVATEAISEPLTFERTGTDGTPTTLHFQPADDAPASEHHTTTD